MAFVLLIEVEATINVPFSCHFLDFYCFSKSHLRDRISSNHNNFVMIFPPSPYVKLNVFDHSDTLLKDTQNNHAVAKFCNCIE